MKLNTSPGGIYKNENAMSVAILMNRDAESITLGDNAFENLNLIWKSMTGGKSDLFIMQQNVSFNSCHPYSNESFDTEMLRQFAAEEKNDDDSDEKKELVTAYVDFEFVAQYDGAVYRFDTSTTTKEYGKNGPSCLFCGYYHAGDTVTGTIEIKGGDPDNDAIRDYCLHTVFAYADNNVLEEYAELLNARDITFSAPKDTYLTGTFAAEAGQRILFTIPWDEGWTCWIDGQEVPIDKTWDLFMSVEVPEGRHTYEMRFFPAWMDYGLIISGAALLGLLVLMLVWGINRKSARKAAAPEAVSAVPGSDDGSEREEDPA